jgi:hypothetical protein
MEFAANPEVNARMQDSYKRGAYAPPQITQEEQARRNMIATQLGISPDRVPLAERMNEINRARASVLGVNEDLFNLAGGNERVARQYQRAVAAGLARGGGGMPGPGGRGGGLGAAYGDMMEKAAAAAAKQKEPEDLYGNKGAQWGGTLGAGDQSANQMSWALQGLGNNPRAASLAAGMTGLLQQGLAGSGRPDLAPLAPMISNVTKRQSYKPWLRFNPFADDTVYQMYGMNGAPVGESESYADNPYLDMWMNAKAGR